MSNSLQIASALLPCKKRRNKYCSMTSLTNLSHWHAPVARRPGIQKP
uniref:Uncharacterized protein n=1 Tax=Anguilla anguilla TaxID=7936 RepID=A0A0E9T558_ANGAN